MDKNRQNRDKVFELCETLGFWNVRPAVVSKQLGVAHQNVSRWKQQWIAKNGIPQVDKYGKELNVHSQLALREIALLLKDTDKKIKLEAIRTFFQSQDHYTKFLEAFDYKSKVADLSEVNVKGEVDLSKAFSAWQEVKKEEKIDGKQGDSKTGDRPG